MIPVKFISCRFVVAQGCISEQRVITISDQHRPVCRPSCCMNLYPQRLLKPSRCLLLHMSSFVPKRASQEAVDQLLTSVYTSSSPRNVFSIAITGGGSGAIADLFSVPGASNSLMSGSVPYSHAALSELLGESDRTKSASRETAINMANAVFKNTVKHLLKDSGGRLDVISESNIFGVACTAALVSNKPRRGLHRCHVATVSNQNRVLSWDVCFQKGIRTRREEDYACSRVVLDAIAETSALPNLTDPYLVSPIDISNLDVDEANPNDKVEIVDRQEISTLDSAFQNLFDSHTGMLVFTRKDNDATTASTDNERDVMDNFCMLEDIDISSEQGSYYVYPGSYNPLHVGHISLAAAAMEHCPPTVSSGNHMNAPLVFEISALNADKPPLSKEEILRRVNQFAKGTPMDKALREAGITNVAVCVTSKPFFVEKADLFPGCRFIMGADTTLRLLQSKYYGNSHENMIASVSNIVTGNKCSFVVGGRQDSSLENGFSDLSSVLADVELPDCVRQSMYGLSADEFRCDISSTEIRNAAAN